MTIPESLESVLYYLGVTSLLKHVLLWASWGVRARSRQKELVGHVTGLNLYPLKSGRNYPVESLMCSPEKGAHIDGMADRHLMVITDEEKFVSARQEPKLLGIISRPTESGLILTASGMPDCVLDLKEIERNATRTLNVKVHIASAKGVDCGQSVADWLTDYLGAPHRMLYSASGLSKRQQIRDHEGWRHFFTEAKDNDLMAYQDVVCFALMNEDSLAELNSRLDTPVKMERFRGNIVVNTGGKPYDEDTWDEVTLGETHFRRLLPIDRCVMTTIDPHTCVRDKTNEPLKTLRKYRESGMGVGPCFGAGLVVDSVGPVKVGDPVYVTRK